MSRPERGGSGETDIGNRKEENLTTHTVVIRSENLPATTAFQVREKDLGGLEVLGPWPTEVIATTGSTKVEPRTGTRGYVLPEHDGLNRPLKQLFGSL